MDAGRPRRPPRGRRPGRYGRGSRPRRSRGSSRRLRDRRRAGRSCARPPAGRVRRDGGRRSRRRPRPGGGRPRVASARSPAYASSTRWASASVSVSELRTWPRRLEAVAQLAEVLDDPVVDDRDLARAVAVGMGVEVVRAARGWPSGCARARSRRAGVRSASAVWRLASLPARFSTKRSPCLVDERDPRRVVAAVLEAPQPLDAGSDLPPGAPCNRRCRTCRLRPPFVPVGADRRVVAPPVAHGASLDAPSRGPRGRRRAPVTSAASVPSTITRSAGSVPEGRTRTRPRRPRAAAVAAAMACRRIPGRPPTGPCDVP